MNRGPVSDKATQPAFLVLAAPFALCGAAVGGCGSGNAEPVAGAGPVEGGLEVAVFVVPGVEGELVDGLRSRGQAFGAERQCSEAGTLEAEEGEEFEAGGAEVGGVGRRLGEGSRASGAGPVGVGDGQRDRLGDAVFVAELGAELFDEAEEGGVAAGRTAPAGAER